MRDKDDDDRDDIDDVEDERLSLQDMKGMRERFVHYLARLDERINFAAAQEKTAIANDKKEIDWLEEHVADAGASHSTQALRLVRDDLGDCTRCKLHQQGRKRIVFGVGNPRAELMFVGEGPGADDDAQGEPFVGRAGQLLNNMIKAMGLRREDVYIANVVKCRPPRNRMPEHDECETCSPFLMRQIAVIKPKVVVALGAVAAKNLLAFNAPMAKLRGRLYDFLPAGARSSDPSWPGALLAVTYHPAFLLRDPRQKSEAWKDLQMVMKYLGLKVPSTCSHDSDGRQKDIDELNRLYVLDDPSHSRPAAPGEEWKPRHTLNLLRTMNVCAELERMWRLS